MLDGQRRWSGPQQNVKSAVTSFESSIQLKATCTHGLFYKDYYNGFYRDHKGRMEKKMQATSWVVLKIMGPLRQHCPCSKSWSHAQMHVFPHMSGPTREKTAQEWVTMLLLGLPLFSRFASNPFIMRVSFLLLFRFYEETPKQKGIKGSAGVSSFDRFLEVWSKHRPCAGWVVL